MWFLLLIPNFVLFLQNNNFYTFCLSILLLLLLLSIIKSTRFSFFLFPFFFVLPMLFFYIYIYRSLPSEQIFAIILESNWQEISQFLGTDLYLYVFVLLAWIFGCIYFFVKHYKQPIVWRHRSRWWIILAGIAYIISMLWMGQEHQLIDSDIMFDSRNNFLVDQDQDFFADIKDTYPLGIVVSLYDLRHEQIKVNKAFEVNKDFKFLARSLDRPHKQIFVLVIGETSRRRNWQLNGYARPTNPALSRQKNLVNFTNMLSVSNATRSSIPMMLTRKPAEQVDNYAFPERSFISAFKEAGFKTYWLSNQQKFGTFDTSTSVYAKEADEMFFLNKTNYTESGEKDDVLIPIFSKIVSRDEQKQLIVIHTLGNHYNYAHRYPSHFDVFRPSLNDLKNYSLQSKKNKEELVNSYDNSILFTDYVLSQFIKKLQTASDTESFLFYSSDHGEDLFDQGCDKSGHGNATKHNFEIAAFAWYSDLFALSHPEKVNKLRQNQNAKISQISIFPTLVEAASIHLPNDPLSKSVTGDFVPYPRLLLGSKDYDQIEPTGICADI